MSFPKKCGLHQEVKCNVMSLWWVWGCHSSLCVWFHLFLPLSAVDLLALLKWKAYPDRVMDILGRLRHVSGEEIVKVLHEITAFGCLCDGQ